MADIIVADDEKVYRHLLQSVLQREGHSIRVAENGDEVLNLIQEKSPDVLITDIIMPHKEGLELINELRKMKSDIKIVVISGGVDSFSGNFCYLDTALSLGANKAILKPFTKHELIDAVDSVL